MDSEIRSLIAECFEDLLYIFDQIDPDMDISVFRTRVETLKRLMGQHGGSL